MKCSDARKTSYLSERPAIVSQDMLEAKRHIKECSDCKEFLNGEKAFGALLRSSVKKDTAPEGLRRKILSAGKPKKISAKQTYRMLAVAASILIMIIAGYIYIDKTHTQSISILEKIVNDHAKFLLVPQAHISSSAPDEVTGWFRGKVDFPVLPPAISATLKGGRLCLLDRRHFALLFYEYNGLPVSVFITDGIVPYDLKTNKAVMLQDKKAFVLNKSGYTILLWEDKGLMYSLVSEMDIKEIQKMF